MQDALSYTSPEDFDALWPHLEALARIGQLSERAIAHLLYVAEDLSTQGEWNRAWRALLIAEQAAQHAGNARYRAAATISRGVLHYRQGDLQPAIQKQAIGIYQSLGHRLGQ